MCYVKSVVFITKDTEDSEARARMSEQETMPGQAFSRAVLISSTTLNPLVEFALGTAFFSLWMVALSSSNSDPSQPFSNSKEALRFSIKKRLEDTRQKKIKMGYIESFSYVNKAVVEMKTDKAGSDSRVGLKSLLNSGANDGRGVWASSGVKRCV